MPFLHPPAIENAEARHAIQRRLHAAGSGSFQRKLRRVQPQVHAGRDLTANFEIVFVQKNHGHIFAQRFFGVKDAPDDVFASVVVRMRLAGENNLKFSSALGDLAQAIEVGKNQVGALVSGGAPREADGERIGLEAEPGLLSHGLEELMLGD